MTVKEIAYIRKMPEHEVEAMISGIRNKLGKQFTAEAIS